MGPHARGRLFGGGQPGARRGRSADTCLLGLDRALRDRDSVADPRRADLRPEPTGTPRAHPPGAGRCRQRATCVRRVRHLLGSGPRRATVRYRCDCVAIEHRSGRPGRRTHRDHPALPDGAGPLPTVATGRMGARRRLHRGPSGYGVRWADVQQQPRFRAQPAVRRASAADPERAGQHAHGGSGRGTHRVDRATHRSAPWQ